MEECIRLDRKCKPALPWVRAFYVGAGILVAILGILSRDPFELINALGTLMLIPALWLLRKLFRFQGGFGLETAIYIFICLSWTVGGAAGVYSLLPFFDKFVHCLSGVLVSMLALTGWRLLEPRQRTDGKYSGLAYLFVFFASMAVAGLFEVTEFALAPLLRRDLQHVLETGVGDTMWDIIVCLAGTLLFLLLMVLRAHGRKEPLTGAAEAFAAQNRRNP